MRTEDRRVSKERKVVCVACARSMQPKLVPWMQHSIGCPVRTADLSVYAATRRPVALSSRNGLRAYA